MQLIVNGMNGALGQHVVNHVALAPEAAPEPKLMEDQNALVIQMKTNYAIKMNVQVCVNCDSIRVLILIKISWISSFSSRLIYGILQ